MSADGVPATRAHTWEPTGRDEIARLATLVTSATVLEGSAAAVLGDVGSTAFGELVAWAWVVDPERRHVLLVDHPRRGVWLPPGGRAGAGEDPAAAAARELREETGVDALPVSTHPALVDAVPATAPDGAAVVTMGAAFEFVVDRSTPLTPEPGQAVAWWPISAPPARCAEHHWRRLTRHLAGAPAGGVLACPNCGLPLSVGATAASCARGHSFDRSRAGHFNLLVGGRLSSSTTPGDTPDALAARRRFLAAGHYAPIAAALAETVGTVEGPLLDVGCGEGYYLSQLTAPSRYGLDVAKAAVQMAARLLPDAQFVVGSAYRLPVLAGSVDAVVSVFAPHPFDEFTRVLRPGGRWVTVTPGPDHLREMRPVLDGEAGRKVAERLQRRNAAPADATTAHRLRWQLDLTADALRDLFFMTPIRWQSGASGAEAEAGRSVTVDVWISTSTT